MSKQSRRMERPLIRSLCILGTMLPLIALPSCSASDGDTGPQGPAGGAGPTSTTYAQGDTLPGVAFSIVNVTGGTAAGGRFRVGDRISVHFTVTKTNGDDWDLSEFSTGRILVSGPTNNYQRVIAEQSDVVALSVQESDGSYTYTFASAIPPTYLPPLNDTPSFGIADGELADGDLDDQSLDDGTYTVAVYGSWNYTLDGVAKRASDDAVFDFVLGNAGTVVSREVVTRDNCNRCHQDLQAHGGRRRSVTLCVMCHTAGAEDGNNPALAGGTPDVSIDFKVMIHRIHSGEHLPSVQGLTTDVNGARVYGASIPLLIAGGSSIHDYSSVAFPAWPHGLVATPRDQGYSALSAPAKAAEDLVRTGPSNCAVCHGDPDGTAGPLVAPAQGDIHKTQPTRAACGACHDDVHWGQQYTANLQTMPSQANNANCTLCHESSGNPLAVQDAHLHPLLDTSFDPGLNLEVTSLVEAGTNDDDDTIDPGEKVQITFTMVDDAGDDVLPSAVANLTSIVSGPTSNYNIVVNSSIPIAMLTGAQPYTVKLPMPVFLESPGASTGALGDIFTTTYSPHWNVSGATTSVWVRTATAGGSSTAASETVASQNYIDVASAASFARDDYIVVDDGLASEEYVRIQYVDGTRLWFGSTGSTGYPYGLRLAHAAGASVKEVALTAKTASGGTPDYSLAAATGAITELVEFGTGNDVVVSYTTDFVMPSVYPIAINGSPDIDETRGDWEGKPIVDGTYTLGIWTSRTLILNLYGEANSYRSASDSANIDFLVGSAPVVEPYALISTPQNCYNCHQELTFHGAGRRSFDSCVLCHGTSGIEDRPQYVAANAPATTGQTAGFRTMLHQIHMGEELANASTFAIVGFGSTAYPNNFGVSHFDEVIFPALPGGVANCAKCHGSTNTAWHAPSDRNHPTAQVEPVKRWAAVCGACHDSTDALAHIEVQTASSGAESCGVCHGEGGEWNVQRMHKTY